MKKLSTRSIAISSALSAVCIVLIVSPIGMLPWFGGASLTIMHIPVILAALLEGPIAGTFVGFIFGISAMLKAVITPLVPLDPFFANPLVSVLPRLFIGVVTWDVFKLFRGKVSVISTIVASICGSLTNTILVLTSLGFVASSQLASAYGVEVSALPKVILTVAFTNGLVEAGVAAVICSAIYSSWKGIESQRGKSKLSEENKVESK